MTSKASKTVISVPMTFDEAREAHTHVTMNANLKRAQDLGVFQYINNQLIKQLCADSMVVCINPDGLWRTCNRGKPIFGHKQTMLEVLIAAYGDSFAIMFKDHNDDHDVGSSSSRLYYFAKKNATRAE